MKTGAAEPIHVSIGSERQLQQHLDLSFDDKFWGGLSPQDIGCRPAASV